MNDMRDLLKDTKNELSDQTSKTNQLNVNSYIPLFILIFNYVNHIFAANFIQNQWHITNRYR